jgi:hypothetical protein
MSYLETGTKAAIEVRAKLSEKYKITNLSPVCALLSNQDAPLLNQGQSQKESLYLVLATGPGNPPAVRVWTA